MGNQLAGMRPETQTTDREMRAKSAYRRPALVFKRNLPIAFIR